MVYLGIMRHWGQCFVDRSVLICDVIQFACSGLQLKEKDIQDLQRHPPILFSQKKKGKKRKPFIKWRDAKMQGR